MTWFKVDDGFWRHRKVRKLGRAKVATSAQVACAGLWTLAGSWASDSANTGDGFIPGDQVETWDPKRQLAERLVAVGLWIHDEHDGESGYRYHDWPDYNPSLEEVLDRKRKRQEAGRRGGVRSGEARRSKREANASANAQAKPKPARSKGEPRPRNPSASNEAELSPTGATAQTIIGEYVDRCSKTPPSNVLSQLGKHVKAMLAEGVDPDDIRRGLATWMTKNISPSLLPSVVNQVMNGHGLNGNGSPVNPNDAKLAAFLNKPGQPPNLLALPGGAS